MWIGYFAQREEELVKQVIASTIPSDPLSLLHSRVGKLIGSTLPTELEKVIASTIPSDPLRLVYSRVGKVIGSTLSTEL